jgi:hypothetical protein
MKQQRLLVKAQELRSEMRRIDLLLQATIVRRKMTCGKPTCHCAHGEPHVAVSLTYKENGKTRTVYIAKAMQQEAWAWANNWRRFRRLLKQESVTLIQALRQRPDTRR